MFPGCGNDDYSYYELHEIVFQECLVKGYKKIIKEKEKGALSATAIYLRRCANMRRVLDFTRIFKGSREVEGQI